MKKVINLSADIDKESAKDISNEIKTLNESGLGISFIEVRINTYGGCVASAYHIINAIKLSDIPVVTVATGVASSAGFMILLASPDRYGMKESFYLAHKAHGSTYGNDKEIEASLVMHKIVDDGILTYIADTLDQSKQWVKDNLLKDFDTWLTPRQAKKLGIIHKVI